MWEFSEMCKALIQRSGMSIYKIAKNSGLERTALNRMINGKRLLNRSDFEKFCDTVRMGRWDREKLYELYLIEKVGKKEYENRKYILSVLKYIDSLKCRKADTGLNLQEMEFPVVLGNQDCPDNLWQLPFGKSVSDSCVEGALEVKALLRNVMHRVFQRDEMTVYTNIPASYKDFFENIEYLYTIYQKKISVYHYFLLHSSPTNYHNCNYNLEILQNVLPWVFSNHQEYYPYYTYSNSMLEDMTNTVMPYFLVTENYVIQIASDMDSAILHTEPQIIRLYHERIQRECQGNMHNLLCGMCDVADTPWKCMECREKMGRLTHCLAPVPCPAVPFSEHMELSEGCRYIYSAQGLCSFCDTGQIKGCADMLPEPLSPQQRLEVLSRLADEARTETTFLHITRKEMPPLQNTRLELYKHGLLITLFHGKDCLRTVSITESSICESFRDFLDSMEEMKLVEDREETLDVLEKCYRKVQTKG